jgi:hypothetical protein
MGLSIPDFGHTSCLGLIINQRPSICCTKDKFRPRGPDANKTRTLAPIRALFPEKDRNALGALVFFYPPINGRLMLAHDIGNLLDFFQCSFTTIHLEQRLENLESPHGRFPRFFWHGHQVGCPGVAITRIAIGYDLIDGKALKSALSQFPRDNGVHTGIVDNNEASRAPANCSSWNEPERSRHAILP